MKSSIILAVTAGVLSADALKLAKRADGQPPRVIQHEIQRKHLPSPLQRVQHDRARIQKRAGSGSFTVQLDNEETLYFMNVTVGTPAQHLKLHLDTGSSDLWVNVANSQLCEQRSQPCADSGTYNANSSSTYTYLNSNFRITYVDGSGAIGDYATDTVSFGGVTLKSQQLGIGYTSSSNEGIIGIGYPTNEVAASAAQIYPNVPESLMINGFTSSNAYSLWLNDLEASTGSILFGGVNTAKFTGQLQTLPIIKEQGEFAEFLIALTAIGANGNVGSISNNTNVAALLDSGSSLMYIPDDAANAIYESVGAKFDENSQTAIVDCDLAKSNQTIDFTFSSPTVSVAMNELVILAEQRGSQKTCILGIGKAGTSTPVLGDTFLRSAYVVYDITNNEISIAQTNFDASAQDNILEITNSTGVPDATTVAHPVVSVTTGSGGARNDNQLTSGSAKLSVAGFTAAICLAAAGYLLVL